MRLPENTTARLLDDSLLTGEGRELNGLYKSFEGSLLTKEWRMLALYCCLLISDRYPQTTDFSPIYPRGDQPNENTNRHSRKNQYGVTNVTILDDDL